MEGRDVRKNAGRKKEKRKENMDGEEIRRGSERKQRKMDKFA